jgi:hypothetical protein
MTAPQGHWRIVAAGFQGDLNLTADPQGNIHGTIKIDAPNVEQIHGFWDEVSPATRDEDVEIWFRHLRRGRV